MPRKQQPPRLLTQKDFAATRGIDPALLSRWKKRGRLVMVGSLVDAEATDRRLQETADPRRPTLLRIDRRSSGQRTADLDEIRHHRARREKAEADRAEQRARTDAREYVHRQGVTRAIDDAGRVIHEQFVNFVDRAGIDIAAEFGLPQRAIVVHLEKRVDELRAQIAGAMLRLAARYAEPGT